MSSARTVIMREPEVQWLPHGVCFTKPAHIDHRCFPGHDTKSVTLGYRAIEVVALGEPDSLSDNSVEVHGGGWCLLITVANAVELHAELVRRWEAVS